MSTAATLTTTLGALEIGIFISVFLFGMATVQSWAYYQAFPNDKIVLKMLVAVVWMVELAEIMCALQAVYVMTVTDYGSPSALSAPPKTIYVATFLTSCLAMLVQVFYAFRIRMLTNKLYIPVFCWAVSFIVTILAITGSVEGFQSLNHGVMSKQSGIINDVGLIIAAFNDVVQATTLCWYFVTHRNSMMGRTASILDQLMGLALRTGLLSSMAAVATAITGHVMPSNSISVAVFLAGGNLAVNSFLAFLNVRVHLRSTLGNVISMNTTSSSRDHPPRPSKVPDIAFDSELEGPSFGSVTFTEHEGI